MARSHGPYATLGTIPFHHTRTRNFKTLPIAASSKIHQCAPFPWAHTAANPDWQRNGPDSCTYLQGQLLPKAVGIIGPQHHPLGLRQQPAALSYYDATNG